MAPNPPFATRLRWLRCMSVACIIVGAVNLLWGAAMLLVVPGWRTVVSWSAAAVAIGAAAYVRHVMRVLRDVS